ncbi:MAG TPA: hypothetical protein PKD79_01410 [Candidatus Doudnabacteria bacterium]|nr:hypothetical protein [Candidatus Doudnabacteria bacterium]
MKMLTFVVALSTLGFIGWVVTRTVASIQYDRGCGGHLKRAADANTIDLAVLELEIAVKYLEANNMTSGYTSIIYQTPDEDVGFFYSNLKASLEELKGISPEATPLERSNILMKLRETLLDNGERATVTTKPPGISIFPHNTKLFIWILTMGPTSIFFGTLRLLIWMENN